MTSVTSMRDCVPEMENLLILHATRHLGPLNIRVIGDEDGDRTGIVGPSGKATSIWTTVVLIESDIPYCEPGASFVVCLCQRAAGMDWINLQVAIENIGWMLPHLLLLICG